MPNIAVQTHTAGFRYARLADELEGKILSGIYKAGERLPSIRRLHQRTGFSITTVYQAFIELEKRGLIVARQKSGYYVKPMLKKILPAPALKKHQPVAMKVSVNSIAHSLVEAMGDRRILQLGGTLVAPELLPWKALHRALKSIPQKDLTDLLTTYANPAGNLHLRRQIAQRSLDILQRTAVEDILITNGCIEAVSLCLQAVARPGDTILVESPTYPWFLQLIEDLRMLALEVPTDPTTGIDLPSLKKAVKTHEIKAAILVPNFHNPLGCLMPDENKRDLVKHMGKHGIPIIEDDIHGDLYFGSSRPTPLKTYDEKGLVLYCSSFSKTLAPGLRIGWTLPGAWLPKVRQLKLNTSIASPTLTQFMIAEFLKSGAYDRHLRQLRAALKNQVANLALAVAKSFPPGTCITAPKGGLMLWVEMDPSIDGLEVYQEARKQQISILPGIMCSASKRFKNCIRISCGFPWSKKLEKGIRTLGRIIADLQSR